MFVSAFNSIRMMFFFSVSIPNIILFCGFLHVSWDWFQGKNILRKVVFFDGEKGKQWFPVNFPANPLNVSSRNCTCTMKRTGLKAGIDLRLGTTFGLLTQ